MDYIDGRKAKRPRVSSACSICRKRKVKCDKRKPTCLVCEKHNVSSLCEYNEPEWSRMLLQQEISKAGANARDRDMNAMLSGSSNGSNYGDISSKLDQNGSSSSVSSNHPSMTNLGSLSQSSPIPREGSTEEMDLLKRKISDLEKIIQHFTTGRPTPNGSKLPTNSVVTAVNTPGALSSSSFTQMQNVGAVEKANSSSTGCVSPGVAVNHEFSANGNMPTVYTPNSTNSISSIQPATTEVLYEEGETLSFVRWYIHWHNDSRVAPNIGLLSGRSYSMRDPIFTAFKKSVHNTGEKAANLLQIYMNIMNVKSVIKSRDLDPATEASFKQKILQLWSVLSITEEELLRQKSMNKKTYNYKEYEENTYSVSDKNNSHPSKTQNKTSPVVASATPVKNDKFTSQLNVATEDLKVKVPVPQSIEPTISLSITQKSSGLLSIIPMKLVLSSYSREFELEIVKLAVKEAPPERTAWLLINRFFKYIHPFAPYLDQKIFEKNIKKLIGPRSQKETKIQLKISNRLDLLQTSLLFIVMLFGSYTLYSSTKAKVPHEDDEDLKYLLDNPISESIADIPKKCMSLFQIIRWSSLEFLQLSVYCKLFQELHPAECDLADQDMMTSALEQMAISLGFHRDPSNIVDISTSCEETKNLWRKIWHFIRHGVLFKTMQYSKLTSIGLEDQYDTKSPVFLGEKNANNNDLEIEKASIYAIHQYEDYYKIVRNILDAIGNLKKRPFLADILQLTQNLDSWLDKQFNHGNVYNNLLKFYDPNDPKAHYNAIRRLNSLALLMEGATVSVFLHYHIFLHYEATNRPTLAFKHYKVQLSLFLRMSYTCLAAGTSITAYFGNGFDLFATPLFLTCVSKLIWSFNMAIIRLDHLKYWMTLEASLDSEFEELLDNFVDKLMKNIYTSFKIYTKVSHNYYFAWIVNKVHSFMYFLLAKVKSGLFNTNNEPSKIVPEANENVLYIWGKEKIKELYDVLVQEESFYLNHMVARESFLNPTVKDKTSTNFNTNHNVENPQFYSNGANTTNNTHYASTNSNSNNANNNYRDTFTTSVEDWPADWWRQEPNNLAGGDSAVDEVDSTWLNKMFHNRLEDVFKTMQPSQQQQFSQPDLMAGNFRYDVLPPPQPNSEFDTTPSDTNAMNGHSTLNQSDHLPEGMNGGGAGVPLFAPNTNQVNNGTTENMGLLLDDVDQVLRRVFNDIGMI